MKHKNNMPTFWLLIITTLLLTVVSLFDRNALGDLKQVNIKEEPLLTSIMQGIGNRTYPAFLCKSQELKTISPVLDDDKLEVTPTADTEEAFSDISTEEVSEATTEIEAADAQSYSFVTSDISYFDDALFIGDSRTVGLRDYSNLKNSVFYAKISSTIYEIMDDPMIDVDPSERTYYGNTTISIRQALAKRRFGKIYIMVGINELGTGTADTYFEQFQTVVNDIRTLQPDAIIYVESIMHVTTEKSDQDPIYNNKNIDVRNEKIKLLADNQSVFYLDLNEELDDATHGLNPSYTFDSVHLKASQYTLWEDYLLSHTIQKTVN